jgi:hypothetical protein
MHVLPLSPSQFPKVAKPLGGVSQGLPFVAASTVDGLLPLLPPRLYVVRVVSQEGGGEVEPSLKVSSPWS